MKIIMYPEPKGKYKDIEFDTNDLPCVRQANDGLVMIREKNQKPFIKLDHNTYENLKTVVDFSKMKTSMDWECTQDSINILYKSIIKHVLAPRHAKAMLEVLGTLGDHGFDMSKIIDNLFKKYISKEV